MDKKKIKELINLLKVCGNCNNDSWRDCKEPNIRENYHHGKCKHWVIEYNGFDEIMEELENETKK